MPVALGQPEAFREYSCGNCGVVYGVNDGETKYIWFSDDDYEYLFDLQNDPQDLHDLSDDPAWQSTLEKQRGRLLDWLKENGDPHAANGELTAIPVDWDLAYARASSIWNNRGRH